MKLQINLRKILNQRKLTQVQLSRMSNVTQSKISLLCNNKMQDLNIGIIERLATALEIEDISLLLELRKEN
jgi:predicted XRE-type DNA-binding protein